MLGLFKLQEKKSLCTNPVYYKTSRAGHKEVGVRGHPWAGEWVPGGARGEKGKGAPKQKGTDCPNGGGVQKARQKRGTWEAGQVSAFSARAQCWRGHSATACPPLALGEPVTHEPLARAPSETWTTARLSHSNPPFLGPNWPASSELGAQFLLTPQQHVVAPLHLRARAARRTAGWTVGV